MSETHIFISWSMPASQQTAVRVYAFFRRLFPTFGFFISSENISSGQRWYDVISDKLDACNVGIIVVTEENCLRPWIHYEAGALAKVVSKARVMPLLCGVPNRVIADTPLSAFQSSELSKVGIRKIADSIREMTGYGQPESDFIEHFDALWDRYGDDLSRVEPSETKPSNAKRSEPNPREETIARLDQLTEIVRSIEARLPSRTLSEADVQRLIAEGMGRSGSKPISAMSGEEIYRALGIDPSEVYSAAAQGGPPLMMTRNALHPDGVQGKRGLLGDYTALAQKGPGKG